MVYVLGVIPVTPIYVALDTHAESRLEKMVVFVVKYHMVI